MNYTCTICRETFETTWSDEEALAEYDANFGTAPRADDPVCDECYQRIMGKEST